MEPKFERNEEQKKALKIAKINWFSCAFVVYLCVIGGAFFGQAIRIGEESGAVFGLCTGAVISVIWVPFANDYYEASKPKRIRSQEEVANSQKNKAEK